MPCATVLARKVRRISGHSCRCSFGASTKELPRAELGEVERGTRAVLDVLSKRIDRGAAVKIATVFPEDLLKFWPAFIQEAVRGRQQGAA